jgi:hypothetical protein
MKFKSSSAVTYSQRIKLLGVAIISTTALGFSAGTGNSEDSHSLPDIPTAFARVSWSESLSSLEELFERADVVVLVKVEKAAQNRADWNYPVVETVVAVSESFKGTYSKGDLITVHQSGSVVAENAELPFMETGTSYLVFLTKQFQNQPQHYILGPDGLYSLSAGGALIRESSVKSLTPFDINLSELRTQF